MKKDYLSPKMDIVYINSKPLMIVSMKVSGDGTGLDPQSRMLNDMWDDEDYEE